MLKTRTIAAAAMIAAGLAQSADAQTCSLERIHPPTIQVLNGQITDLEVFDDGSGAGLQVYVCGQFTETVPPRGIPLLGLAKIGPAGYEPVGDVSVTWATTLEVFDDGNGPALWVGGGGIRKWSPSTGWSALTTPPAPVFTLNAIDLGSGPSLYAGTFGAGVLRLNGGSWVRLGTVTESQRMSRVQGLAGFDADGNGPGAAKLYAAGAISQFSATTSSGTAVWDGAAWGNVTGSPAFGWTKAIAVFNNGTGPRLHWGSHPTAQLSAFTCISRFDGAAWTHPTSNNTQANPGYALTSIDMGPGIGPRLFSVTSAGVLMSEAEGTPWRVLPGSPTNVNFVSLNYKGTALSYRTPGGNVPVLLVVDGGGKLARYAGCPRCPGDRNLDGQNDLADLFDFLDAFFKQVGGVQELFDFIADWFGGC